jgi:hypothetical protein
MHGRSALAILGTALGLLAGSAAPAAAAQPSPEYQVKAAFLLRFAMFVEWPDGARPAGSRLVVAVVGDSPLADALDAEVAAQKTGAAIEIRRGNDPEALVESCQILFVPAQIGHLPRREHPRWKNLAWLGQRAILTVGEDDDFIAAGGVIAFHLEAGRVCFDIDQKSADNASLTISSHLLRLARNRP